jgi:hydrogenase nickel incorporation protein HypB
LATDRDAQRLAQSGAPVRQITTGTVCHLDAQMVEGALHDWSLDALDVLFIENVGNLVCPASYDLGEHARIVLMAVTEGEDKPRKYPTIFDTADLALITKVDLADAANFNREEAIESIRSIQPALPVIEVSCRMASGITEWLHWLKTTTLQESRGAQVV